MKISPDATHSPFGTGLPVGIGESNKNTPWGKGVLGDAVLRVLGGGTPLRSNPTYWGGEIPWASVKDFRDGDLRLSRTEESITTSGLAGSATNLVPAGIPIICTRMAVGRVACADVATAINQDLKALFLNTEKVKPAYALRHLDFLKPRMEALAIGSTVKGIDIATMLKLEVSFPPIPEQARIAEVLDTLDEVIRRTQTLVEKNGRILLGLQERFFAPRGGQERKGWQETRLEAIAESITSGPRGWACHYADEGDLFLRIGNLTRKHLDLRFDDVVKVKPPAGAEGVRTALAPGDLLVSITADLGIIGVVPDWLGVAYINQHIARARLNRSKVNPRFLGYQLAGQLGQKQFYRLNDVGAKAGLNLPSIGRLKVWLPSLSEQERMAEALDAVQLKLREDRSLLTKLEGLKSGLSRDLLSGAVRVEV